MCRQAAESVMRAYRDGYTRQAVRLRLDAAYSGQEDLRLGESDWFFNVLDAANGGVSGEWVH